MSTHGLDLGTLDLASGQVHEDGYTLSVLGSGASFGSSQAAVREIVSMLADGNLVSYDRAGNREATFDVLVEGADGVALQAGEVALRRELYRPNTVTWTPPADFSAPTVFVVITSEMAPLFDDIDELRTRRKFRVTLTCAPFAQAVDPTVAMPLSVGGAPSVTVFDTCNSATGWSATIDGVAATATTFWEAGTVGVFADGDLDGDEDMVRLTRTGSVDFTGTPYLIVEARGGSPANKTILATANGVGLTLLDVRDLGSDHLEYTYLAPSGVVSSLSFTHTRIPSEAWVGLFIYDLTKSNMPPGATARQLSRIVPVAGTERTPASLAISSADGTTNLGMTVVHTSPQDGTGYSPPLRRWRVAGGNAVTTDAATMSGGREPLFITTGTFVAEIPNQALPEGGYLLAARMRRSATGSTSINWAAETVIGGVSDGYGADFALANFPVANSWFFVPIAVLTLPTVRSYGGKVKVSLNSPASNVEMDEAWLFRVDDDCALTVIHNTVKPRLWLDSPDVTSSVPRIWIGDDENRLDAFHPGANLYCHGNHTFSPDEMSVFVGSSGTQYPDVTLTHYAHYPNNAA